MSYEAFHHSSSPVHYSIPPNVDTHTPTTLKLTSRCTAQWSIITVYWHYAWTGTFEPTI